MILNFKKCWVLFVVLGLSVNVALAQHNASKAHNTLEPLYGIEMGQENITIQVKSNGCTRSEHFKIKIANKFTNTELKAEAEKEFTIQRLGNDHCRRMPFLLSLNLPLPEIHGPFILMNPLKVWRIKKRQ